MNAESRPAKNRARPARETFPALQECARSSVMGREKPSVGMRLSLPVIVVEKLAQVPPAAFSCGRSSTRGFDRSRCQTTPMRQRSTRAARRRVDAAQDIQIIVPANPSPTLSPSPASASIAYQLVCMRRDDHQSMKFLHSPRLGGPGATGFSPVSSLDTFRAVD